MSYIPYVIVFEDGHRDSMYLSNPTVGDVIKTNLLTDEELEYFTIVSVDLEAYDPEVHVKKQ